MAVLRVRPLFASLRYSVGTRRLDARRRAFFRQFVRRGDLCFDIGANRGERVRLFLNLGARVVAVEPQRLCQAKLERTFAAEPRFTLVSAAVGAQVGTAELYEPEEGSGLASMSRDWIERVQASGRFGATHWEKVERVPLTTLDELIAEHGVPSFCKIDVEGYEHDVLLGLTAPIASLSFEFTPEHVAAAEECIARIRELGPYEFNLALDDELRLELSRWANPEELVAQLRAIDPASGSFGDVYARSRSASS